MSAMSRVSVTLRDLTERGSGLEAKAAALCVEFKVDVELARRLCTQHEKAQGGVTGSAAFAQDVVNEPFVLKVREA